MNEQGKIVLSILWIDPENPNKLKDGHFFIHEIDQVITFRNLNFYFELFN
jgi:hypothetical protein